MGITLQIDASDSKQAATALIASASSSPSASMVKVELNAAHKMTTPNMLVASEKQPPA